MRAWLKSLNDINPSLVFVSPSGVRGDFAGNGPTMRLRCQQPSSYAFGDYIFFRA